MNLNNFLSEERRNIKVLFIGFSADGKQLEISKNLKNENGELFAQNEKVSSFKFVVIGAIGKNVVLNSCLEDCITVNKIGCLTYGAPIERYNKVLQTMKMKSLDVSQIKTIIGRCDSFSSTKLIRELKLPIVSKIIDGSQGKGIEKHETKADLEKFLKKKPEDLFIFQEFVPNDGDVRMFYVKNRIVYCITRKSQKESEFRNNVSLGGKQEFIDPTAEMKKLGDAAVKSMSFDVTGVDLIQDKNTKKWYVMEINAAPQFDGDEVEPVCSAILGWVK
jgi:RimK family alpha-L-glutamate ligase